MEDIPTKVRLQTNIHFMDIIWKMLCSADLRKKIASIKGDPEKHCDPTLISIESWWWITYKTDTVATLLIQIAKDPNFIGSLAGDLCTYITSKTEDNAEVSWGPWDHTGGEEYDSGYCINCGQFSYRLIGGLCPNCR